MAFVVRRTTRGWTVQAEGASVLSVHETQQDAIDAAKAHAIAHRSHVTWEASGGMMQRIDYTIRSRSARKAARSRSDVG
jgi:hypothetical protein